RRVLAVRDVADLGPRPRDISEAAARLFHAPETTRRRLERAIARRRVSGFPHRVAAGRRRACAVRAYDRHGPAPTLDQAVGRCREIADRLRAAPSKPGRERAGGPALGSALT